MASSSPIQSILKVEDLTSEEDALAPKDNVSHGITIDDDDDDEEYPNDDGDEKMLSTNSTNKNNKEVGETPSTSGSHVFRNVTPSERSTLHRNDQCNVFRDITHNPQPSSENRISFKIVQITDHGRTYLTTVPSAWERLGTVYWPHITSVFIFQKLIQNACSEPEKYWFSQPCKLKKENFRTFEDAEADLKRIENKCDANSECFDEKNTFPQMPNNSKALDVVDNTPNSTIVKQVKEPQNAAAGISAINVTNELSSEQCPNFSTHVIESKNLNIGSLLEDISQNLSKIVKNQNKMLMKLSNQNVFNDTISDRLNQLSNSLSVLQTIHDQSINVAKELSDPNEKSIIGLLDVPISCQDELDKLESDLNDSKNMEHLVTKMKRICGETGTIDATNCCYNLVDHFFTRSFLLNVTWSGGSRTESIKIALKNYRNILCVFNTLVIFASKDFDENKSREFFKTVLKNAKKRFGSGIDSISRKSSKRVRRKTREKEDIIAVYDRENKDHVSVNNDTTTGAGELNTGDNKYEFDFDIT